MANHYIYHYVARRQKGNETTTIDGIALATKRIVSQEDYRDLKRAVVGSDTAPENGWIIESLSYLGREREPGVKA